MNARPLALTRLVALLAATIVVASVSAACAPSGPAETETVPVQPVAEVTAVPTLMPTTPPTLMPTATVVPVTPLASPSALRSTPPESFFVRNTLGRGMTLRRAPTSAELLKAWPDGTMMEGLGAQQDARGWTWTWVRDPDGNVGWMPSNFLVRSLDEPPAPLPLTPAPAQPAAGVPAVLSTSAVPASGQAPPNRAVSPVPRVGPEVIASASRRYTSGSNDAYIVGSVENKGPEPVVLSRIALSLLSETGATVGALNTMYQPGVLQPGAKAPWLSSGTQGAAFKAVKAQAEAVPFAGSDAEPSYTRDFRLEGVSVVPGPSDGDSAKVAGQVVNTGASTTRSIKILVAVYAADGSLADVGNGSVKLGALAPGQSAPFETSFTSGIQTITRYDIFVEGSF